MNLSKLTFNKKKILIGIVAIGYKLSLYLNFVID